ncbi:MAG: hypothetical protein M1812_003550 [Candelaria pacifica]|nr:MAG: hypothetical protein M1812_003550 [Candelaria pacifica]
MPSVEGKYRSLSPTEAQKRGQQLYRQKNYEAALEAFTAAIAKSNDAPTSILDNRAATYEKLGDLSLALGDGKRMIQHEKMGSRAYLRTGKILMKMDKPDLALDIYKYGLRNVPADDPAFELLRDMKAKLSRENRQAVAVDPFQILPMELAEMIIKQLDFNNLVKCLGVSKTWNTFLSSMTSLWTELDLSRARKPVRAAAIRACIRRSKGNMTKATLNRVAISDSDILKQLAVTCRRLDHVEVCNGFAGRSILEACPIATNLKTLLLRTGCEVTSGSIEGVIGKCANLERAEFGSVYSHGFPLRWPTRVLKLRTLRLGGGPQQTKGSSILSMNGLLECMPNLQSLALTNWKCHSWLQRFDFTSLQRLEVLDISGLEMLVFPKLPPTLHTLNLSRIFSLNLNHVESRNNIQELQLSSLRDLSFDDAATLNVETLQRILGSSMTTLERLTLNDCLQVTGVFWLALESQFPMENIVELQLRGTKITDREIFYFYHNKNRIRRLDLSKTSITGVGIRALVTGSSRPQIEWLGVNNCSSLGSDAVDLARSKGIEVEYRFPDTMKSGKRICIG